MTTSISSKQYLASLLPHRVMSIALTLIGILFIVEASSIAKPKSSDVGAYLQCIDWCDAHNKTSKSRIQCYHGCDNYYSGVNKAQLPPAVTPTPGSGSGQVSPPP